MARQGTAEYQRTNHGVWSFDVTTSSTEFTANYSEFFHKFMLVASGITAGVKISIHVSCGGGVYAKAAEVTMGSGPTLLEKELATSPGGDIKIVLDTTSGSAGAIYLRAQDNRYSPLK